MFLICIICGLKTLTFITSDAVGLSPEKFVVVAAKLSEWLLKKPDNNNFNKNVYLMLTKIKK